MQVPLPIFTSSSHRNWQRQSSRLTSQKKRKQIGLEVASGITFDESLIRMGDYVAALQSATIVLRCGELFMTHSLAFSSLNFILSHISIHFVIKFCMWVMLVFIILFPETMPLWVLCLEWILCGIRARGILWFYCGSWYCWNFSLSRSKLEFC